MRCDLKLKSTHIVIARSFIAFWLKAIRRWAYSSIKILKCLIYFKIRYAYFFLFAISDKKERSFENSQSTDSSFPKEGPTGCEPPALPNDRFKKFSVPVPVAFTKRSPSGFRVLKYIKFKVVVAKVAK